MKLKATILFGTLVICMMIAFNRSAEANTICTNLDWHSQPFDVLHYGLDAFIENPEDACIIGKCTIDVLLKHESSDDRFFFHLYELNIDSCVIKGIAVLPDSSTDSLGTKYFAVPIGSYAEDTLQVEIYYSGTMQSEGGSMNWGGVHYMDSTLFSLGPGFNLPNISFASSWLPCYDHPSDKAQYTFRFTVPKQFQVACGGDLIVEEPVDTVFATYRWKSRFPSSTYLMCFAVGRFDKTVFDWDRDDLTNVIYTRPEKTVATRGCLRNIGMMLDCYESYFGKYPLEKLGFVSTAIGSMEHQSMISIAKDALVASDTICENGCHEVAHSWFGDLVTPRDFRSVWLKEGLASYCETLWKGYNNGTAAYYRAARLMAMAAHGLTTKEGAIPLYDFPRQNTDSSERNNYPNTIYKKGAAVIHELRYYIGNDSLFFGGLRDYINKYKYGNANNEDFKATMEEYTGIDLTEFFDMWVYGIGYPLVDVNLEYIPYPDRKYGKCVVSVVQKQHEDWGKYKDFPFEINFKLSSGEYYSTYFNIDSDNQVTEVDSVPAFTNVYYNMGKVEASLAKVNKSTLSSVPEFASLSNLKIYPNPVRSGVLYFELPDYYGSAITATVFDISGKVVLVSDFGHISAGQVCVDGLQSGAYSLVITDASDGRLISEALFNVTK